MVDVKVNVKKRNGFLVEGEGWGSWCSRKEVEKVGVFAVVLTSRREVV